MGAITHIAVLSVVASVIFVGFGTLMGTFSSQYNVPVDDINSLNKISEINNQTNALKEQLEGSSVSASDPVNAFIVITNSGLSAVGLLFNLPGILLSMITDFFILVPGIPVPIITATILVVLIIIVLTGVLPLILRSKTP